MRMRTSKLLFIVALCTLIFTACSKPKEIVKDNFIIEYGERHSVTITDLLTDKEYKYKIVRSKTATGENKPLLDDDNLLIINQGKRITVMDKVTGEAVKVKP